MTKPEQNGYRNLELQIRHERELRTMAEEKNALALKLQAEEYTRRLEVLNHAHKAAVEDKAQFLQKALYEASEKELQRWKLEVNTKLATQAGATAAGQRIWGGIILGISLAIAVISFIVNIFWK